MEVCFCIDVGDCCVSPIALPMILTSRSLEYNLVSLRQFHGDENDYQYCHLRLDNNDLGMKLVLYK